MVEAVKGSLRQYLRGLKDSFYGLIHIFHLNKKIAEQNRKKRQRMQDDFQTRRHRSRFETRRPLHSSTTGTSRPASSSKTEYGLLGRLSLNTAMSILIWISIWGFYGFLVPWLKLRIESLQQLMLPSNLNEEEVNTSKLWEKTEIILQLLFSSLWVLPLYFISKIVNALYFVDISNAIFQYYRGQPQAFPSTGRMIADLVFSLAVETIFLIQATLMKHIPYLVQFNFILFCIHHCLLYALYAFEYKWFNMGLDFRLRVHLVETHWPYFCGFGTPLFILTYLSYCVYSMVISACIFSFFFPFFIISATKAETPPETPAFRFRIFDLCMTVCDTVFKFSVNTRMTDELSRDAPHSPAPR